jgi:hypothetical protein
VICWSVKSKVPCVEGERQGKVCFGVGFESEVMKVTGDVRVLSRFLSYRRSAFFADKVFDLFSKPSSLHEPVVTLDVRHESVCGDRRFYDGPI